MFQICAGLHFKRCEFFVVLSLQDLIALCPLISPWQQIIAGLSRAADREPLIILIVCIICLHRDAFISIPSSSAASALLVYDVRPRLHLNWPRDSLMLIRGWCWLEWRVCRFRVFNARAIAVTDCNLNGDQDGVPVQPQYTLAKKKTTRLPTLLLNLLLIYVSLGQIIADSTNMVSWLQSTLYYKGERVLSRLQSLLWWSEVHHLKFTIGHTLITDFGIWELYTSRFSTWIRWGFPFRGDGHSPGHYHWIHLSSVPLRWLWEWGNPNWSCVFLGNPRITSRVGVDACRSTMCNG